MASKEVRTPFGVIHPNRTEKPPGYDAYGQPTRQNLHQHKRAPRSKTGRCVACGEAFEPEEDE